MGNSKHEDAIMKMGFRYFRDTILKLLGIDYTYVDIGPTELVELTIHSLYMDFTFLTTSGQYVHAEFQTTNGGEKDLRRFHAYEAVLSHESGKSVITYVIYSGGIKNSKTELDCGVYTCVYIQSDTGLHDCQRRGRDKGGDCHDQIRTDVV